MGNVPVSSPGSLSCLPGPGSDLQGQHDQGDADHDDDEELGRPDLWCHVSVAHGGKGDDAEVEGLEEGELLTCSFQMLDAAGAAGGKHRALEHPHRANSSAPCLQPGTALCSATALGSPRR